jgi:hypothetical protein
MVRILLPVVRELVAARRHVTTEARRGRATEDAPLAEPAET